MRNIERTAPLVTVADKIAAGGFLTIQELAALKSVGRTTIYEDIQARRLPVEKLGRSTRIAGAVAKAYVPGRGLAA
ncbi:excisionase family DNA-binding protein [Methylocystis sp. IM3]|uniref:excisionase family DNA-binding protein n=1 Tax=unclassified Methylocystis TaxID=2625913 RepID=UPI0030F9B0B9